MPGCCKGGCAAACSAAAYGGPNAPRLINTNLLLCGCGSKFRKCRVFYCTSGGEKLPRRFLLLLYCTNLLVACDHNDTNFQKNDTSHTKVSVVCKTFSSYRLGLRLLGGPWGLGRQFVFETFGSRWLEGWSRYIGRSPNAVVW